VIGQEQEFSCRGARDAAGGSVDVEVEMHTCLVLVLMISLVAEPVIVQRQEMAAL